MIQINFKIVRNGFNVCNVTYGDYNSFEDAAAQISKEVTELTNASVGYFSQFNKKMVDDGKISWLELQPCFTLIPSFTNWAGKKVRPCHYTADFLLHFPDGREMVVEVKGFRTRDYVLRRKMFEYKYPQYEFKEVR